MHTTVGQRLKDLRRELARARGERLTQEWLAAQVGVPKGTVAKWETDLHAPSGDNLVKLAGALGTTAEFLLHGAERPAEETGEDALHQTEVEREVERVLDVVRLVGGKTEFTEEQRRGLKRDILNTYIDAFQEDGFDVRELYVMLGRVDRGEL